MQQLVYALRFRGTARRTGVDGNILETVSCAPGCRIDTRVIAGRLVGELSPNPGDETTVETEMVFTGETSFLETGSITFGSEDNRLRFSTVGSAYLGPLSQDD